jgi:transposase
MNIQEVRLILIAIEGSWGYAKVRLLRYHGISPQNFLYYLKEIEIRFIIS